MMNSNVVISCAITGAGDTTGKSNLVPITPKQIADSAVEAAKAGASIVHCHVREPDGKPSRKVAYYKEVTDRIRDSGTDVIINLTCGMGGELTLDKKNPMKFDPAGTDLCTPEERIAHLESCLPEIATLDCGTLNFGDSDGMAVFPPSVLRQMAKLMKGLGIKPEMEVFDTGHLWFAKQLVEEGLIDGPPMFQVCLGIPWGAPADAASMKHFRDMMPQGAFWAGFGISRNQMPMVAQAVLLGGNVRVGLEDNIYLERGKLATNAQLVEKARKIIELLGATVTTPKEARQKLGLRARN
jgi:uncharacterized protein (DUF849 family)